MAKFVLRKKAIKLRKRGMSIGSIASLLNISKSTSSKWCLDINLTDQQRQLLELNSYNAGQKGRLLGAQKNREKKLHNVRLYSEKAKKQIATISSRDMLIAGTALYWAEGAKTSSTSGFSFMNSDPNMILFMKKFLTFVMDIKEEDITCTIQINSSHKVRINKVLKFWSSLLKLPLKQFRKPYYVNVRHQKIYDNHDVYYGTLRMKVRKSSNLKYYMLGLIEALMPM